jgi:DNA-binding transcriptional LysR family regulator
MSGAKISDLISFATVARLRSFRGAALELGVSASALSHALRGLEERLGVRLLNRTTRSVVPSEAGQRLLERLGPALRDIDDALDDVNAFRDTPIGTLRLNVPRSAAHLLLAPLMARYLAAYPQMRLEIAADNGLVDIVAAGYDAGVRFGETLQGDMVAIRLGPPQRLVVVASPAYVAKHGAPATPQDLHDHACIRFRFPSGKLYRWEFAKDGQAMEIDVDGPLTLGETELMIRAAEDGVGLACALDAEVEERVRSGRLVRVLGDWCPQIPGFYLYYPSRRQMAGGLRALVEMLRADAAAIPTGQ